MPTVRAKTHFAHPGPDGYPRVVNAGALFDGDDPVAKKFPHLFEPVEVAAARAAASETASAAPGERRVRGRSVSADAKSKSVADEKPQVNPKSEETGS